MANVFIDDKNMTDIGNAIREKLSVADQYLPSEMAQAIKSINSETSNVTITEIIVDKTCTNSKDLWDYIGGLFNESSKFSILFYSNYKTYPINNDNKFLYYVFKRKNEIVETSLGVRNRSASSNMPFIMNNAGYDIKFDIGDTYYLIEVK